MQETIDIVRAHGGNVAAVGVILDRSGETKPGFGCPFVGLTEMNVETFPVEKLPPDLAAIPAVKPGSKSGAAYPKSLEGWGNHPWYSATVRRFRETLL